MSTENGAMLSRLWDFDAKDVVIKTIDSYF